MRIGIIGSASLPPQIYQRFLTTLQHQFTAPPILLDVMGAEMYLPDCDVVVVMLAPQHPIPSPLLVLAASQQQKFIMPVLVAGASMPLASELDSSLAFFSRQQGLTLRNAADSAHCVRQMRVQIDLQFNTRPPWSFALVAIGMAVAGVPVALLVAFIPLIPPLAAQGFTPHQLTLTPLQQGHFFDSVAFAIGLPVAGMLIGMLIFFRSERRWNWIRYVLFAMALLAVSVVFYILTVINAALNPLFFFILLALTGTSGTLTFYILIAFFFRNFSIIQDSRRQRGDARKRTRAAGHATYTYFLSYRREDSNIISDRIARSLRTSMFISVLNPLNAQTVFRDVQSILGGADFVAVLQEALTNCQTMFVIIGSKWLHAQDDHGQRRLDSSADYVRIEIATALQQHKVVIPVLIDATPMPAREDLPADIQSLADAVPVRVHTKRFFRADMRALKAESDRRLGIRRYPFLNSFYYLVYIPYVIASGYALVNWKICLAYILGTMNTCHIIGLPLCQYDPNSASILTNFVSLGKVEILILGVAGIIATYDMLRDRQWLPLMGNLLRLLLLCAGLWSISQTVASQAIFAIGFLHIPWFWIAVILTGAVGVLHWLTLSDFADGLSRIRLEQRSQIRIAPR